MYEFKSQSILHSKIWYLNGTKVIKLAIEVIG